jgi:catechol 2,3-dioxygenase-like lactoylglutathione lyase family enzyme
MTMKIVPIFYCSNMREAVHFYTRILDFELAAGDSPDDVVADLHNGNASIQLTSLEGNQKKGFAVNVWVNDVDVLFEKYISRGLDTSGKKQSPVHQGPLNQTWGRREFYVTDADGNTLRFTQPL